MPTTDELRAMLAESIAADEYAAAEHAAADAVGNVVADIIRDAVALAAASDAAGLPAVDLSAVLAAAVERATPVAPAVLAAIVAPDPIAPAPVAVSTAGAARRVRRRVERDWTRVESGSIWHANLAGASGRVKITVDPDGRGATFTVTTPTNRGQSFRNPSRAVQSACGNPAGRGRKGEATVNGFLALVLARTADGNDVIDGDTLDDVTGT